jgi:hypothetical protein
MFDALFVVNGTKEVDPVVQKKMMKAGGSS